MCCPSRARVSCGNDHQAPDVTRKRGHTQGAVQPEFRRTALLFPAPFSEIVDPCSSAERATVSETVGRRFPVSDVRSASSATVSDVRSASSANAAGGAGCASPCSSGGESTPLRPARPQVQVLPGVLGRLTHLSRPNGCEGDGNPPDLGSGHTAFDSRASDHGALVQWYGHRASRRVIAATAASRFARYAACVRRASAHWSWVAFVMLPAHRDDDTTVKSRLRAAHATLSWPSHARHRRTKSYPARAAKWAPTCRSTAISMPDTPFNRPRTATPDGPGTTNDDAIDRNTPRPPTPATLSNR